MTQANAAMSGIGPRYLTRYQVAAKLALSYGYLAALALKGDGPPVAKLGRSCRYREDLVEAWARARTMTPTAAKEAA